MIPVTLKKPHTHAGTLYSAGTTISVTKDTAEYLEQHGIGAVRKKSIKHKGGSKS